MNVTAVGAGTATITVTDTQSGQTATIEVTVEDSPLSHLCPDDQHPHLIDLGLPSGTKWACCNVGAAAPESYGGYYAWGETAEKTNYGWNTYLYGSDENNCDNLGSDIAGTDYDVAHVEWGGSWVMPSKEQQEELLSNCTSTWTTLNGVNGRLFTSSNGFSIFLPATGFYYNSSVLDDGSEGKYWSSTQLFWSVCDANMLYVNSEGTDKSNYYRFSGQCVRPVSQ